MKNYIIIIIALVVISGCQRSKLNELSVEYNESLIIPPKYDLPLPGKDLKSENKSVISGINIEKETKINNSENELINLIISKTNKNNIDATIREKIDYEIGYKNEKGFFDWLLMSKTERDKLKKSNDTVDPFEEKKLNSKQ